MINTSIKVDSIQVYPLLLKVKGLNNSLNLHEYKIYSELKNYSKNQITYKFLFSNTNIRDNFIKTIKGHSFVICSPRFFYLDNFETVLNG